MKARYFNERDYIKFNNSYWEIIKIEHSHLGRGKANLTFILKNLENGSTLTKNFNPDEEIEEIDIEKRKIEYLFRKDKEVYFLDENNKKYRLDAQKLGNKVNFLKKDLDIKGLFVDDELIGVELPIKAVYEVISAPPNVKGNSEKTNSKIVTIETGAQISAPLFINVGDKILINLEKGEYVERAK
jgi:elongation factor P